MGITPTAIAGIAAAASSVAGLGMSLFNKSSFNMPSISNFNIPQSTVDQLTQQINQNTALGTQANAAAQQAISQYASGQLSSAYQGQYNSQYQQQLQAVQSQLAAQGFDKNSTQYQSAMQNFQTWAGSLYSTMLQNQLQGALSEAGLDQNAIASVNAIISTESNVNAQNNQAALGQGQLQVEQNQVNSQNAASIGKALGNIGTTLGTPTVSNSIGSLFGGGTKPATKIPGATPNTEQV